MCVMTFLAFYKIEIEFNVNMIYLQIYIAYITSTYLRDKIFFKLNLFEASD